MDAVIKGFLQRNLPKFAEQFKVELTNDVQDRFTVTAKDGTVFVEANNYISACHGIYTYLKTYCHVQLSWCGNREISIDRLTMFDGELTKEIEQKYRVYMNYCTLDYSMCWWDFSRWEKEIDFMAMNGINMPLAVVGSEAVWFETLLEFDFTREEALATVSGPAFWAWQLMTNIDGYLPPKEEAYIEERKALGQQILNRYLEFGMQPIQQGFAGHVPVLMKEKFPQSQILMQRGWCNFPKTAQLDPLDPLFDRFMLTYLQKLSEIFGNYHFLACDPFHEGTPPKQTPKYLHDVGATIDRLYKEFDPQSVWVMQTWSMRKDIVKAVPKDRLLLLDLNSRRTFEYENLWGYPVVAGMLHNFGGRNNIYGKLANHCENAYLRMKNAGANVVGSGLFMEAIEQNPVVYDLQFELLTTSNEIDLPKWIDDYILRRYGVQNDTLREAFRLLLQTCYASNDKYKEERAGSMLTASPQVFSKQSSSCAVTDRFYDLQVFDKAVALFFSVREEFKTSDGYQYDLCDLVRQALSNRFYTGQQDFANAYKQKNADLCEAIAKKQLSLLKDMDELLSHRSEFCFSRWLSDAHRLAANEEEKRYFDLNARTLLTAWGDIRKDFSFLNDYAWREWNGLIGDYYYKRWQMFYEGSVQILRSAKALPMVGGQNPYPLFTKRKFKKLNERIMAFTLSFCHAYDACPAPTDSDVIPSAARCIESFRIGV